MNAILSSSWSTGEWSVCSKSCGGGEQSRQIQCVRKLFFQKEEIVAHALCPITTPSQIQTCNNQDCPPKWSSGPWSQVLEWQSCRLLQSDELDANVLKNLSCQSTLLLAPSRNAQDGCDLRPVPFLKSMAQYMGISFCYPYNNPAS